MRGREKDSDIDKGREEAHQMILDLPPGPLRGAFIICRISFTKRQELLMTLDVLWCKDQLIKLKTQLLWVLSHDLDRFRQYPFRPSEAPIRRKLKELVKCKTQYIGNNLKPTQLDRICDVEVLPGSLCPSGWFFSSNDFMRSTRRINYSRREAFEMERLVLFVILIWGTTNDCDLRLLSSLGAVLLSLSLEEEEMSMWWGDGWWWK